MTTRFLTAVLLAFVPDLLPAAEPLGGASPPRLVTTGRPPQPETQYKRVGQWALKRVLEGKHGEAVRYLNGLLEDRPDDSELHFPFASYGVAGMTILSPGVCRNIPHGLFECV